jgi:hypothetical protein
MMDKTDHARSLNYSTQALEQLEVCLPLLSQDLSGIRTAHTFVAKQLRDSVKFLLPNCAELVDMNELRQAHVDMARLPYSVVALEAPWLWPDGAGGDKQGGIRSSKRIALCLTMSPEVANWLPDTRGFLQEERGGVIVIPLYWEDRIGLWKLPMGGAFVPHDNEVTDYSPGEASLTNQLLTEPYIAAGLPLSKLRQFRVSPFLLLPEIAAEALEHSSGAEVAASVLSDTRDEVSMLLQTCVVLNCANVTTAEIAAPKLINRKRKRKGKGKPPLFSYRVLQISAPRATGVSSGGGQHASPRAHLRRGHVRRLEERPVWVRPAMVNSGAAAAVGQVKKEYSITPVVSGG